MDYNSRFKFGLTICMIFVFWSLAIEVDGQKLAERSFGARNVKKGNIYGRQYDVMSNARLDEKKSEDEPYHEVYTLKDNTGNVQRIHYAVDDQGLRANFHSNNVNLDPIIGTEDLFFGARLNTKPQISSQQNLASYSPIKDAPLINNVKPIDISTEISPSLSISQQARTDVSTYFPKKEERSQIPEFINNKPSFPVFYELPKRDSGNFAQIMPAKQIHSSYSSVKDAPLIDEVKSDVSNEMSPSLLISQQAKTDVSTYFPKKEERRQIPEFINNKPSFPVFYELPKRDSRNFAQIMPAKQVHGESLQDDAVNKPNYNINEQLLKPTDFLREKPLTNSKPILILQNQFVDVPKSQNFPVVIPVSTVIQGSSPEKAENISQTLDLENAMNSPVIESEDFRKNTSNELNLNNNVETNLTLKSAPKFTPYFKSITKKDALGYKIFKSSPISFTSRLKYPISTIFDTSDKNGQYYRYSMNLGPISEANSLQNSAIFSTGDGLFKILNQTNIPYYKITSEIVPYSESKTYLSGSDKIANNTSNNNANKSNPIGFNLFSDKKTDESKSILKQENIALNNSENKKDLSRNIKSENILSAVPIELRDQEFNNNFTESSVQEQAYSETSSYIDDIFDFYDDNVSSANLPNRLPELLYSTPSPYVTILLSENLPHSYLSNLSAAPNLHSLTKQFTNDYVDDLESLTAILDSSIFAENSESQIPISKISDSLNTIDPDYLKANDTLTQSTTQSINEHKSTLEDLTAVTEAEVTNSDLKATSSLVENILENITDPATTFSTGIFTSTLPTSENNGNMTEEDEPNIEGNNTTPRANHSESDVNLTTISNTVSEVITDLPEFLNESTTSTTLTTFVDISTLTLTESTIENNTIILETSTMSPIKEVSAFDSIDTNSRDETGSKILTIDNESISKPVLELVIQNSEMNDLLSRLNNMPMFIRVMNPGLNNTLSVTNETDSNVNIENIKNNMLNYSQGSNETKVSNAKEELFARESNPKFEIIPSDLRIKPNISKSEFTLVKKPAKNERLQKIQSKSNAGDNKRINIQKGRNKVIKIKKSTKRNGNLNKLNKTESTLKNTSMPISKSSKSYRSKTRNATRKNAPNKKQINTPIKVNSTFLIPGKPLNVSKNIYNLLPQNNQFISSKFDNSYSTYGQLISNENFITSTYHKTNPSENQVVLIEGLQETIGEPVLLSGTISSNMPLIYIADDYDPSKTRKINKKQNVFISQGETKNYPSKVDADQMDFFSAFGERQQVPSASTTINSPQAQIDFEYIDVFPYDGFNQPNINEGFRNNAENQYPEEAIIVLEE